MKSFWIEVCYKILEKKNKIIDKTLKYKKIFFNLYEKIKKIKKNTISKRIYFAYVKILKNFLKFFEKIKVKLEIKKLYKRKIFQLYLKQNHDKKDLTNLSFNPYNNLIKEKNSFSVLEVIEDKIF